jgi:hypothetical protein
MDLVRLRHVIGQGAWRMTRHALDRCDQRGISLNDVENVLLRGAVVEDYPDDRPFPSALLRGETPRGALFAVVALGDELARVVTVHWLDPERWLDPQTRRDRR